MAILKTTLGLLTAMTLASAAASLVGCQDTEDRVGSPASNEPAGTIGLELQAAPGFVLNTVSYAITGPGGFTKAGTIDVSHSQKISALIGPLPTGKGFTVTLTSNPTQGGGTCSGSASFNIQARVTTPVTVHVTCHDAARSGSVLINGTLNVCPTIDGLQASPGEVAVDHDIALGVVAHDTDVGPSALRYHWTVSSGKLSDDSVPSPTFTCTEVGPVKVGVTVSDGDSKVGCPDSGGLIVECTTGCESYNHITAALGELSVDCRGRLDPRDYAIGDDGRIVANFDSCPASKDPALALLQIKQLLAVQKASNLPDVMECTAGRFKKLKEKFATSGIEQCPVWSNKIVQNPPTRDLIDKLSGSQPRLLEDEPTVFDAPVVLPPELDALKIKSTYIVTSFPGAAQPCGSAASCAAACAEAFPGFVLPTPPGTMLPENTVLVDPDSWWGEEFYPAGSSDSDPYNMNTAFYHQMGFVLPAPGDTYGALARWNPCNLPVADIDPATGLPITAAFTTSTPVAPECVSERCNYWAGGSVSNPVYVKTRLQRWCADPSYADQSTCLSFCGPKPPPMALP